MLFLHFTNVFFVKYIIFPFFATAFRKEEEWHGEEKNARNTKANVPVTFQFLNLHNGKSVNDGN